MTAWRARAWTAACVATWSTTSTASAKTAGRARPVTHVSPAHSPAHATANVREKQSEIRRGRGRGARREGCGREPGLRRGGNVTRIGSLSGLTAD